MGEWDDGMMELTRESAWAAAHDAATKAMRKGGRTVWSQEDFNVARKEFDRLWPEHLDMGEGVKC